MKVLELSMKLQELMNKGIGIRFDSHRLLKNIIRIQERIKNSRFQYDFFQNSRSLSIQTVALFPSYLLHSV